MSELVEWVSEVEEEGFHRDQANGAIKALGAVTRLHVPTTHCPTGAPRGCGDCVDDELFCAECLSDWPCLTAQGFAEGIGVKL